MAKETDKIQECWQRAFSHEVERGSCPQCVLAAVMETLGAGDPATLKAADALAGGTALSTEGTCGALVGGLLAIGSLAGRDYEGFCAGQMKRGVFRPAMKLYERFVGEYGSALCKDLQVKLYGRTYKLSDPSEYRAFEQNGARTDKCARVAANVAGWTAQIILEMDGKDPMP